MASVWITTRDDQARRQALPRRVPARRPRESPRYGGSFKTQRRGASPQGVDRRRARRAARPRPRRCSTPSRRARRRSPRRETLAPSRDRRRASRPRHMHRSAFARIFKVAPAAARPADRRAHRRRRHRRSSPRSPRAGYKRETIKKTRDRARAGARLLRGRPEPGPRRARQAAEGAQGRTSRRRSPSTSSGSPRRVAREYVLPLLVIDECGPRVNELATAQVGDLDEHRRAIRVRWTVEKNERYRHLELPDDLFAALAGDAAAARGPRPRRAAVPRPDRRPAADGDHAGVQGDRDAALLAARAAPPPRLAALQAHRLARRGRRAARRLEAGRRRPLRVRADRLPRGRPAAGAGAAVPVRPLCSE